MASVKVKFRKSTVNGKAGTVFYQLCHRQKNRQISTRIHLYPEEWDEHREQIILSPGDHERQRFQHQIDRDIFLIRRIIEDLDVKYKDYTLYDIITRFRSPGMQITLFEYFNEQIKILKMDGKLGTARNYQRTMNSFFSFLGGKDISFALLDERVILNYNDWLQRRGVVRNTVSFYMRILRSVYNKAAHQKIVNQMFPFQKVYTGIDKTRKRAIDENIVVQMQKLDLSSNPPLELTRDLFVFSYCTRGMAFVDMAFLRRNEIKHEIITYIRRKTGQTLCIHIEPCIRSVIERYLKRPKENLYVFPLLTSENSEQAFKQYQTALGYYNRQLKILAKQIGISSHAISSYTARHTWATTARNHNVPLSVISAGMGHSSEKTTQIYLASLENSVIDQANRGILAVLNNECSK